MRASWAFSSRRWATATLARRLLHPGSGVGVQHAVIGFLGRVQLGLGGIATLPGPVDQILVALGVVGLGQGLVGRLKGSLGVCQTGFGCSEIPGGGVLQSFIQVGLLGVQRLLGFIDLHLGGLDLLVLLEIPDWQLELVGLAFSPGGGLGRVILQPRGLHRLVVGHLGAGLPGFGQIQPGLGGLDGRLGRLDRRLGGIDSSLGLVALRIQAGGVQLERHCPAFQRIALVGLQLHDSPAYLSRNTDRIGRDRPAGLQRPAGWLRCPRQRQGIAAHHGHEKQNKKQGVKRAFHGFLFSTAEINTSSNVGAIHSMPRTGMPSASRISRRGRRASSATGATA